MNILSEFEKRYKGDPRETMAICEEIANKFNLNGEEVADYVYLNRYVNKKERVEWKLTSKT